jgi:hypothetical protein
MTSAPILVCAWCVFSFPLLLLAFYCCCCSCLWGFWDMYDGTGSVFFKKRTVRTSSCRCMASCSNMRVTPGVPFFSTVSFVMLFQTRVNATISHVSSNLYLIVLVIISISFAPPSPPFLLLLQTLANKPPSPVETPRSPRAPTLARPPPIRAAPCTAQSRARKHARWRRRCRRWENAGARGTGGASAVCQDV